MVAYDRSILCEYSKVKGNFNEFVMQIIKHLKKGRFLLSYRDSEIIYARERDDQGLMFLLIAGEKVPKMSCFVLLERLREEFKKSFVPEAYLGAKTGALNKTFKSVLEKLFVSTYSYVERIQGSRSHV